jgi:HEAT repeat protein
VALQIPEDTRPEVKAILKAQVQALASSSASARAKAAVVLGELREQARPVRGLLCRAMLDPSLPVREAAADALKLIDPKIHYLAMGLVSYEGDAKRYELLSKIEQLKDDGMPLAPLVASGAIASAKSSIRWEMLQQEMRTLAAISRNDLRSYRLIDEALVNPNVQVRYVALEVLPRMKHGRRSVGKVIALLKADTTAIRLAAIECLTSLADETNEEAVTAAIHSQRNHPEERVRSAVEVALNKLKAK